MTKAITVRILGDDSSFTKATRQVEQKSAKLSSGVKRLAGGIAGAFGGLAVAGFAKSAIHAAEENQRAQASLAQTLRITTHATGEQISKIQEWIVKTAEATGISKQELIPAYRTLVNSTHDAAKAQSLLKTAMDTATGTGKPLGVVALAIGKAYNGNVTALKKFVPSLQATAGGQAKVASATKGVQHAFEAVTKAQQKLSDAQVKLNAARASGKPAAIAAAELGVRNAFQGVHAAAAKLTDTQSKLTAVSGSGKNALEQLSKAMGGQTAKAAETTAGKMARLRVKFGEIEEKIGGRLLPILAKLADLFLKHQKLIIGVVGALVGMFVLDKVASGAKKAGEAFKVFGTLISKLPMAFTVLKGAMLATFDVLAANPIILIIAGIAALVLGLIYAYKHFEAFRRIVDAVFGAAKAAASALIDFFQGHWKEVLLVALTGPIGLAIVIWKNFGPRIVKALGHIGGTIWKGVQASFGFLTNAIKHLVTAYVNFYIALPGRIIRALGKIGQTVWKGIKESFGFLRDAFHSGVDAVVSFFAGLPGRAMRAVGRIGSRIWGGIKGSMQTLKTNILNDIGRIVGFFFALPGRILRGLAGLGSLLFGAGKELIGGLARGISAAARSLVSHIPGGQVGKAIVDSIGSLVNIPLLAEGGIVTKPTLAVIGEKGPEAIVPLKRGRGGMGPLTQRGGGSTYTYNFHFPNYVGDKRELAKEVRDALVTMRRQGFVGS